MREKRNPAMCAEAARMEEASKRHGRPITKQADASKRPESAATDSFLELGRDYKR